MVKLKLKEEKNGIKIYSGIKDYFNNSVQLWVNDEMEEIKVMKKNKNYKKHSAALKEKKLSIDTPEFLEVIDFTPETVQQLEKNFSNYKHTAWTIWE